MTPEASQAEADLPPSASSSKRPDPDPRLVQRLFLALWVIGCVAQVMLSIFPVLLLLNTGPNVLGLPMDKVFHALAFAGLGLLTPLAFHRRLALGLLLISLLALASEYVQQLVLWRTFSPADLLADAVGLAPGFLLGRRLAQSLYNRLAADA